MPAFVSLAFALPGAVQAAVAGVRGAIGGLNQVVSVESDGSTVTGQLTLGSSSLPAWLRAYAQDGWTSLTIDVEEPAFEQLASEQGRAVVVNALLAHAVHLVVALHAPYVHVEEEAEAYDDPRGVTGDIATFGITVLRADLPGLERALGQKGVIRVDRGEGWVVVWRRPDPVPRNV